jgi:formate dehydrogenase iron-sulfur subunit
MATETQFAFLLDLARCIGCEGCVAACKTGNELPERVRYIEIGEITLGAFPEITGYVSNHRCYHCTDAACVAICPTGALYKEVGLTRLDSEPCIGCGRCVRACPYDVPRLHKKKSIKCDGCKVVVEAGGTPWCVKTCPSHALMYGARAEILAEAHARVEAIKARYPDAQVYGETQAGGLGVVVVLPAAPEVWGLSENPDVAQRVRALAAEPVPARSGFGILSAVGLGLAAIINRRNALGHIRVVEPPTATPDEAA